MPSTRTLTREAPKMEGKTEDAMGQCEVCGNTYDKCIRITMAGNTYVFDCLECAIPIIAPLCAHCTTRIVGHGLEVDGAFFCCAHCAEQQGVAGVRDRA